MIGLGHRRDHRPDEMPGGQQQNLCIARAIAIRPALILADEPTGELESHTGREILALFRQIAALEGTALIVGSHDLIVSEFTSATYTIDDGLLVKLEK